MNNAMKWAAMACVAATLSSCGGGGGGGGNDDPQNAADGLGNYGELPGTVKLGYAALPNALGGYDGVALGASSMLDDAGRALVAWRVAAPTALESKAAWARSNANGTWATAQTLAHVSNVSYDGMVLRSNARGDAVLGWVDTGINGIYLHARRALRFNAAGIWSNVIHDVSGGVDGTYGHPGDWDLTILSDGRITTMAGAYTGPTSTLVIDTDGQQNSMLTSTTTPSRTAYALRADGNGYLYTLTPSSATPGAVDLVFQYASLQHGTLGGLPIDTYDGLCDYPIWLAPSSVTAISSAPTRSAAAVLIKEAGDCTSSHHLELLVVDDFLSTRIDRLRANTSGTWIPAPPTLAMDRTGNTLAIWKEATGEQSPNRSQAGNTYRLMWAQALAGQSWSAPRPLIPNLAELGKIPHRGRIVVSMNAAGQAAGALVLNDPSGSALNASIVLSRFDFTNGWSSWRKVANKQEVSEPSVSINASGQGLLAYTAIESRRVDGKAPNGYSITPGNPPPLYAYAWRF